MNAIEHKPGNVLDITLKGKVTKEDYETILPTLQSELNGGGVQGVLWDMSPMETVEPRAMWEDLKFDLTHRDSFERIAIVGDESLHKWAAKVFRAMTNAEVKYFDRDDRSAASEWVGVTE